ncbi:hypothetical protein L0F67_01300 [Actinobacillus suis]|nr:hypothetical protein [Actinobacillus suis]UTH25684.1 hypothetical protein L0F67_01300 [Actinobacillus suis]
MIPKQVKILAIPNLLNRQYRLVVMFPADLADILSKLVIQMMKEQQ